MRWIEQGLEVDDAWLDWRGIFSMEGLAEAEYLGIQARNVFYVRMRMLCQAMPCLSSSYRDAVNPATHDGLISIVHSAHL